VLTTEPNITTLLENADRLASKKHKLIGTNLTESLQPGKMDKEREAAASEMKRLQAGVRDL
jgi:hypothetical protein